MTLKAKIKGEDSSRQDVMQSTKLQIGFDPGASLSKIVYSVNRGQAKILSMEPDVLSLPANSVDHLLLTARPEDQAWIKLSRQAERIYVCGFLAKEFSVIEQHIKLLKYEHAIYKFLAAVGTVIVRERLKNVQVETVFLLPYGEISSRDWLQQKISKSLKRYYFQDKLISSQLASYQGVCEGSGMAYHLIKKYGINWFNSNRIVILIFGYRNISCLTFNRGSIETQCSATGNFGFVNLIDRIIARTPGQNRYRLTEAVYALGTNVQSKQTELRLLIRSTQPENIKAEAEMLANAIEISRNEYWQVIREWLNLIVPETLDYLIISGGTGVYLKNELDQHFEWAEPEWFNSKSGELKYADPSLQFRFADVMALFEYTF